ncbi:MAG: AmmeMemoRadiSam system protein B [Pseudomonadota bacterium]
MAVRKRALPEGWYPASEADCRRQIRVFTEGFHVPEGRWIGGVAPHAGWYFSGKAAAKVVSTLAASWQPDRVVLYGGHLPAGRKPIAYMDDSWETPFGPQPLDTEFSRRLVETGHAAAAPRGFEDNTVEILLPFVRYFFGDVPVLAVHSPASADALSLAEAVMAELAGTSLTAVFIGSADLTHYGPNYGFSPKGSGVSAVEWVKDENDRSLIDKALELDVTGLLADADKRRNTCSAGPIASVAASTAKLGVTRGRLLDYYTSYDVMPNSSFVGYAAIIY